MKTVETTFVLTYNDYQYENARAYVMDMKKHPNRVYWKGKEGKSDEELIISHIAHRILSGFYNHYNPMLSARQIMDMKNNLSN